MEWISNSMTFELLIICKDSFLLAIDVIVFMVREGGQIYLKENETFMRLLKEGGILMSARTKLLVAFKGR